MKNQTQNQTQTNQLPSVVGRPDPGRSLLPQERAHDFPGRPREELEAYVMDLPEFRSLVRDIVEAIRAEEVLIHHVGHAARSEIDAEVERRDVANDVVRGSGVPMGDHVIDDKRLERRTPENVGSVGGEASPNALRRRGRIRADEPEAPLRRWTVTGPKFATERRYREMKRVLESDAKGNVASGRRPLSTEGLGSAPVRPAIGDVVRVDGVARRYLGRTLVGKSAYADLTARVGFRPAVRIGYVDCAPEGDAGA